MTSKFTPAKAIATVAGIGLIKPAPGTWGSLVALPLGYGIGSTFGSLGLAAASLLVFGLGAWAAGVYEKQSGSHDPGEVVIDEVAGQWVAMLPVIYFGLGWLGVGLAFVLFRLFDIWKPGPIRQLDQSFPGGIGTMIDDVAAGIVAAALLFIAAKADIL
jgi:phosphatidylglycerophosphatase A